MAKSKRARLGGYPGTGAAFACADRGRRILSPNSRIRHLVRHFHRLGPRPVGELLAEVAQACPEAEHVILDRLERFAILDRELIVAIGADEWLEPHQLLRAVAP